MIPSGLVTIAKAFQFTLDETSPLAELQDRCMQAVLDKCQGKQWQMTESCKTELSELADKQGKSLLMRAIELKDDRMVEEFVYRGISLSVKDRSNNTALHYAAQGGVKPFIEMLLPHCSLEDRNASGDTPFDLAKAAQKAHVFVNTILSKASCSLIAENRTDASPMLKQLLPILEKNYGKEHKKVGECLNLLGENYYRRHQFAEALDALNRAREIPGFATYLVIIGECYYKTQEYRKAIDVLEQLVIPHGKYNKLARYEHLLGKCYQKVGEMTKAEECFSKARDYRDQERYYKLREKLY